MKISKSPFKNQILFQTHDFIAELCINEESLNRALNLRYNSYHKNGMINKNNSKTLEDEFDYQNNATTILIWSYNNAVGTIRNVIYSNNYQWKPIPLLSYDPEFIKNNFKTTSSIFESSRFAISPQMTGKQAKIIQGILFRIQIFAQLIERTDYTVTLVRENHVKFYERYMKFKKIEEIIETDICKATPIYHPSFWDCTFPYSKLDFLKLDYGMVLNRYSKLKQSIYQMRNE